MFNAPNVAGEGIGPSPIRLRALSLGAGVQSTTMALMAAHEPERPCLTAGVGEPARFSLSIGER